MSERTCVCGHQHEEHYLDVRGAPCGICACFAFRPAAVSAPAGEATPLTADVLPGIPPAEQVARLITDLLEFSASERPDDPVRAFAQMEVAKLRAHQAARVLATFCSPVGNYGHRSPAPASGAPGEEGPLPCALGADPDAENDPELSDEAFAKWRAAEDEQAAFSRLHALTMGQKGGRPDYGAFVDGASAQTVLNYVARLEARLAAAERAGVALREALLGNDPAMPPALQPLSTIETAIALACDMAIQDHGESDEDYESVWSALMDARQACKTLRAALSPTSPPPSPEEER